MLANDPDADRLAAAEQQLGGDGGGSGQFTTFSGNDIGLLLADWVWTNFRKQHPEVSECVCMFLLEGCWVGWVCTAGSCKRGGVLVMVFVCEVLHLLACQQRCSHWQLWHVAVSTSQA